MKLPSLPDPRDLLRGALKASVDRQPTWSTPHTWADTDGLYANDQEAWLYRALPDVVMREPARLGELLLALARQFPGRQAHLLTHGWEHLPSAPAGTPPALAAFQTEALNFLTPVRTGVIGLELAAAPAGRVSPWQELTAAVDDLLGEATPDFCVYDADREAVTSALDEVGTATLGRRAAAYLESWFTLGAGSDVAASEGDDVIRIGATSSSIELVTAGPLEGELVPGRLDDIPQGAVILSVRGALAVAGDESGAPTGVLMRTSVIFGRRADKPEAPFNVALRTLKSITTQPLPLRQLDALHETLPCSPRRLAPNHQRVGARELTAMGFGDSGAPGAVSGLLLGRGGRSMTRPVYVNPLAGNHLTLVTGRSGAGKTFVAEALALQAKLGGFDVTYIAGDTDSGAALTALLGTPVWTPSGAGDLDPFRWLEPGAALNLVAALVAGLDAALTADELAAVTAGFSRSGRLGAASLLAALGLIDSPTAVAKIRRALSRGTGRLLASTADVPAAGALPGALRVDLSAFAAEPRHAAVAAATLAAHACATAAAPRLIVVDGLGAGLPHPAWDSAVLAATQNPHAALLVTADSATAAGPVWHGAGNVVTLAGSGAEGLALTGLEATPARLSWLEDAAAVLTEGEVLLSAAGVYRAPDGSPTGVSIGPWPVAALQVLTRGGATRYAS